MGSLISVLLYLFVMVTIGSFALQYDLQFWLPYIVHHAVHIPFLACLVAAVIVGGPAMTVAVLTWLVSFVL